MKIAFVFPGQGSQSVGMLDAWSDSPSVRQTIEQASSALGQDLGQLIAQGPAQDLNLTTNTQPVMLAASVAIYRAWLDAGGAEPSIMAGHSLGEYSALTAAGALRLDQAVPLVRVRADAMQAAVPVGHGAMAAVLGLSDQHVLEICAQAAQGDVVEAVNFNAPEQVVIAGQVQAVGRACALAKEAGAKRALMLPVSAPFHSSLLKPAATVLQHALDTIEIQSPRISVINNVDVQSPTQAHDIKNALVRQAWHAVRWVEIIRAMKAQGVTHVVECGPGKVLTGLVKRIDRELTALSITDPASMHAALDALKGD